MSAMSRASGVPERPARLLGQRTDAAGSLLRLQTTVVNTRRRGGATVLWTANSRSDRFTLAGLRPDGSGHTDVPGAGACGDQGADR